MPDHIGELWMEKRLSSIYANPLYTDRLGIVEQTIADIPGIATKAGESETNWYGRYHYRTSSTGSSTTEGRPKVPPRCGTSVAGIDGRKFHENVKVIPILLP